MPTATNDRPAAPKDSARTITRVAFPTVEERWRFEGLARKQGKTGRRLLEDLALSYLAEAEKAQQETPPAGGGV